MYSLEYRTMVQVLRQLGSSGEFHADVPSHAILKGGGEAILQVKGGNVTSCLILSKNRQKAYHNSDAQNMLLTLGILDWRLTSSAATKPTSPKASSSTARNGSAERSQQSVPQRLKVPAGQYNSWPALERSVYFLADGTHSVEQIAQILSRPVAAIERIIYNFEMNRVITR